MKNKSLIAVSLSFLLILLGGLLPRIWGTLHDAAAQNKIAFASIENVQLEFVQTDVSLAEIMSIAARSTNSVEVPADLATNSESEIKRIAQQAISAYRDAGLIPHEVVVEMHLQWIIPSLMYDKTSSRKSNLFWELSLGVGSDWALELIIDDKTGKVCSIHYDYHVDPDYVDMQYINTAEPIYEDLEQTLSSFRSLFLNGLGEDFASLDTGMVEQGTSISIDEGFASSSVTWPDSVRGECHVVFYVMDTSFYTILY